MTYQELIESAARHWKTTPAKIEDIMNKVAFHESKGKNVYQESGGPGAGLFQYERNYIDPKTGESVQAGGMTARNRLATMFGNTVPDWLVQKDMNTKGFDASKLNKEQQRMLFIADKRLDPNVSMTPETTEDIGNWWAKSHWKGSKEQYSDRIASFNRDLEDYKRFQQPVDELYAGNDKLNRAFPK